MRRTPWTLWVALLLALGCSEKGRSLVLVEVTADVALAELDHVTVVVVVKTNPVGEAKGLWPKSPPLRLGVYVDKAVSGDVVVLACGFDGTGGPIAYAPPKSARVQPGNVLTPPVPLELMKGDPDPRCVSGDSGHGGSGGASAGTGGAGGLGGTSVGGSAGSSSAGRGGSAAGTGGVAGTGGGVSGAAGATAGTGGGMSGHGGGTAGATAGTGGGMSGHGGGTAGTGGTAGSGGTAMGTGGTAAGTGGHGGGAGVTGTAGGGATGTAGTGGMGGHTPGWVGAKAVAPNPSTESSPAVAVDAAGNAVVIYVHGAETWASKLDAASGNWGTPVGIDTRPGSGAQNPKVAVDKNGTYTSIWAQVNADSLNGVWQSTSADGVHWSAPTFITTSMAQEPALAMNADGAAVVAWTEFAGLYGQASASTRAATGAAWSAPTVMRAGDDNGTREPVVAISGLGDAFVGWIQTEGGTPSQVSVWMRVHTSAGWNTAALMETYDTGPSYSTAISANKAGNAIVTFVEESDNEAQLWSRRYAPASGFAAAVLVARGYDIDPQFPPSVTLDDTGTATAAWAFHAQGMSKYNVYTSRSGPSDVAWPTGTAMETDNNAADDSTDKHDLLDSMTDPLVQTDPAGNVTLVWRKRTPSMRFDLWGRRFSGGSWGAATLLEALDTNSVLYPSLAVGTSGTAVVTWYYGTTLDVWANVYR